jgi:hypothetical protein
MKVLNSSNLKKNLVFARNGPEGNFKFSIKKEGMPVNWDFNFEIMSKKKLKS